MPTLQQPPTFPGYALFAHLDASSSVAIGSIGVSWLYPNISKRTCDESSACHTFSDHSFRAFSPDPGRHSYLSMTRCVGAAAGVNISGGCVTTGSTPRCYLQCAGGHGEFVLINQQPFSLPPDITRQQCELNLNCVGFITDAIGVKGWFLMPAVDATASYAIKLPNCPVAAAVDERDVIPQKPHTALPGFYSLPWSPLGASAQRIAFGPSATAPDPNYNASVMTEGLMRSLCAANSDVTSAPTLWPHPQLLAPSTSLARGERAPCPQARASPRLSATARASWWAPIVSPGPSSGVQGST